jgi:hypothetical protein
MAEAIPGATRLVYKQPQYSDCRVGTGTDSRFSVECP